MSSNYRVPKLFQHKTAWVIGFVLCASLLCFRQPDLARAQQNPLVFCATVVSYTPATAVASGSLAVSVGGITLPATIAPGAVITNANLLTPGANVCFSLNFNAAGAITGGTASPNQPTPTPTPTVTPTVTPTPTPTVTPTPSPTVTPTPSPTVTPTPSPTVTPTPSPTVTPTPSPTVTPTPSPTVTPTPSPTVTPTPSPTVTPTPSPTVTPTPSPTVTPTPSPTVTPTPSPTVTPSPTPTATPSPTPTATPGTTPTPNPNCGAATALIPASTFGFTTTNNLPQGDLFLLNQQLFFTATLQPSDGLTIAPISTASFGGTSSTLGGFASANLSSIGVTTPGSTFRAVTCTDSFRDISFVISATSATTGDRIRLFTEDASGGNMLVLASFTIENGVARLTEINAGAQLFLNSRLGAAGTGVAVNTTVPLGTAAGTSGNRTGLLTLRLSQAAGSAFANCLRLGLEITRGSAAGQSSIVFTDVTVNRQEVAGDRTSTGTGLLGGGTGGFPSGARCQSVCPTCTTRCNTICLTSPQYYLLNMSRLPAGAIFISGVNLNNPINVQNNRALIEFFLARDDTPLDRFNAEFIALQLSVLGSTNNFASVAALRSPLSCYGAAANTSIALSNGVTLTGSSTLADLITQAAQLARGNRAADLEALTTLLDQINGNDAFRRCARSTATQ